MQRFDLILAFATACILWTAGSWYWYTCSIKDLCEDIKLQSAWIGGWQEEAKSDISSIIPVDEREDVRIR
ncbi:MAG: hypothetical protein ACKKL4_01535 [Patescibacteria group bacterium]